MSLSLRSFWSVLALLLLLPLSATTDKYRLVLVDDPATTITVAWNQVSGSNPIVRFDVTDHGMVAANYAFSKSADRITSYRGMNNHFARLSGLQPNTNYYFLIQDSQGVSQRFWFRTAPADQSRLSFIAGGDSRNNRTVRRNANLLVSKLKPHAVLFGGDMINSDVDLEWNEWMDDWQSTTAGDGRMTPIVPARGNHEASGTINQLFDTPNAGSYYALTFGSDLIRTYTLNSEISVLGDQLTWLDGDLAAHPNVRWKSAQYHKPMRPHTSNKSEGNHVYNAWAQRFYDNNVRLVVDCDSHMAKTTWPLAPSTAAGNDQGFIRDDGRGTVYAGEGCWGAPLRPADDSKSWTRAAGSFNQFKLIFVDFDKIELRTVKVDNAASVAEVSNTDPFTLPAGLDLWSPPSGAVVTILPAQDCPNVGAPCDDGNPDTFDDTINAACECVGTPTAATLTLTVNSGNDDVEEAETSGTVYSTSSDLELVFDDFNAAGNQTVGIRFSNSGIPAGATITEAYLQFTADEVHTGASEVLIRLEAADNAAAYTTNAYAVSSRSYLAGGTSWAIPAWNTVGEAGAAQRSPSLIAQVQTIVNRAGYQSGNALALAVTGTGRRAADSAEGGNAPRLIVSYTLDAGCTTVGEPCDDGDGCTENDVFDADCNCAGTFADSDGDGICDSEDICPGGDDTVDANGDGVPDACEVACVEQTTSFPQSTLTHGGSGTSSVTLTFVDFTRDVRFTLSDLNARLSGKGSRRFIDQATVRYVNGAGNTVTYGVYSGSQVSSASIDIATEVQSVTVLLEDGYDGSPPSTLSIQLGPVDICAEPCDDSDADGVCDADDLCPGFDDTLDADNDGIPDDCDDCNTVTANFPNSNLSHSGGGSTTTSVALSDLTDVQLTIGQLGARTGGKPANRFSDEVTVSYRNAAGTAFTYGNFSGTNQSTVNVSLPGTVSEVSVTLSNGVTGGANTVSVSLSAVSGCTGAAGQSLAGKEPVADLTGGKSLQWEAADLRLFPNPATERVQLTGLLLGDRPTVIDVFDTAGRHLRSEQTRGDQVTLLVNDLAPGLYLVRVSGNGEVQTQRLVVRR